MVIYLFNINLYRRNDMPSLNNLNVLIKIQDNQIHFKKINGTEWIPLNLKLMEGFNLSLIQAIKLKLIELDDYPIS